jgi:hypothetical protein
MSLLTRINTCVLVASILLIRATPGKVLRVVDLAHVASLLVRLVRV